ncbi:MAG TPA: tyrosine-protein phosphatase [Acetobacteraceae bacterium]|nr:tyrosine-protein phosphatase [Acetobacteraceae bacterium]
MMPRVLPLEGASNVRDLGGWPTEGGGSVRTGLVFRAAALSRLTGNDIATLAATGLRSVVDLRGVREAAAAPSALGDLPGVRAHHLPIEPSVGASLRDLAETGQATGENVMDVMRRAYVAYAFDWAHRYRALFGLLLDPGAVPLMFHCSAGKDRTGFAAAVILTLLGVPYDAVREDYLATNRLWQADPEVAAGLPPAMASVLLSVHAELLDGAFAAIGEFGGFDRYAAVHLGIGAAEKERLRARYCG